MSERKIDYWECDPHAEGYQYKTVNEAVEWELNPGLTSEPCEDPPDPSRWPDVLKCHAFARQVIDEKLRAAMAFGVAERFFEDDLEEYINPDTDTTPDYAVEAAREFVDKVLAQFVIWPCEEVPTAAVEVNVADWVMANKPEWCEQPDVAKWLAERTSA